MKNKLLAFLISSTTATSILACSRVENKNQQSVSNEINSNPIEENNPINDESTESSSSSSGGPSSSGGSSFSVGGSSGGSSSSSKKVTPIKATKIVKGAINKGTFKLGSLGHDINSSSSLAGIIDSVVARYTQDIGDPSIKGKEFANLPKDVILKSHKTTDFGEDGFRVNSSILLRGPQGYTSKKLKEVFENMSKKKLDALFVSVENEFHNSRDAYKSIVEKKEFKGTNLFLIGNKSKHQQGFFKKTFSGEKVSTASYNKYAAAYGAGFQAAISTLKWSEEEKSYQDAHTTTFFIGSINNSIAKKKAFAFRRGVEAASAHPDYAAFLRIKFVSKEVNEKSINKKLYYDVSDWKNENKIHDFTLNNENFVNSDYKIIYIAGTTAEDWRGKVWQDNDASGRPGWGFVPRFKKTDTIGLIGAMHKWRTSRTHNSISTYNAKKYSKNTSIVLDQLESGTWKEWTKPNHPNLGVSIIDTEHSPGQWYDSDRFNDKNGDAGEFRTYIEMNGITLFGSIGDEKAGTEAYVEASIKALFLGGFNYMLGKHIIFGSGLKVYNPYPFGRFGDDESLLDASSKRKETFDKALEHIFAKELKETNLTSSASWMG